MAARNIVNRQLAFFFSERRVARVPADRSAVPPQNGTLLRCEKVFVLLKRSVDAVPGVGPLAIAIGDAIEAIKNAAVMGRMNLGILTQAAGDDPISIWREYVMENFVSPHAARRCGFVEAL